MSAHEAKPGATTLMAHVWICRTRGCDEAVSWREDEHRWAHTSDPRPDTIRTVLERLAATFDEAARNQPVKPDFYAGKESGYEAAADAVRAELAALPPEKA